MIIEISIFRNSTFVNSKQKLLFASNNNLFVIVIVELL